MILQYLMILVLYLLVLFYMSGDARNVDHLHFIHSSPNSYAVVAMPLKSHMILSLFSSVYLALLIC